MTTSSFICRVKIFHNLLTQTINKTKSKIASRRVNRLLKMCRTGGVLSPVIVTDIVDFCYALEVTAAMMIFNFKILLTWVTKYRNKDSPN